MLKITNDNLLNFFKPTTFWTADNVLYNPYNFISRSSNQLVVTIGDSWTWGDSIGCRAVDEKSWTRDVTGVFSNNTQDRLTYAYGNLVSEHLKSDWLNLAAPGHGNPWIVTKIEELSNIINQLSYSEILVIITFSEVGREFNTEYDCKTNYYQWFEQNISNKHDFYKLFDMLNQKCIDVVYDRMGMFKHVKLKIGTNFVDHCGFDKVKKSDLLEQPWYQVMGIIPNHTAYVQGSISNFSRSEDLVPKEMLPMFKEWMIDISETAMKRIELLYSSQFEFQHPVQSGHVKWANYILENLNANAR